MVVDVGVDIENLLDVLPISSGHGATHAVPGGGVSVDEIRAIAGIDEIFIAAIVVCVMAAVLAFGDIVETPVEAIDKEVGNEPFTCIGVAHVLHRFTHPLVADHGADGALG